jgi:hypothetical protein
MAGGTWIDQNKVRPGVYINYSSSPSTLASMGERGVVCIAKELNWGDFEKPIVIEDPAECFTKLGYDQMSDEMIWLRQFLVGTNRTSGASKVLVWRLATSGGAAATAVATKTVESETVGSISVVAKCTGTRGNDITVIVTADPDNSASSSKFYVQTLVSGQVVDNQTLKADSANVPLSGLVDNNWVSFVTKEGQAFACNLTLAEGANGTVTPTAFSEFMTAMELESWNVLAYGGSDNVVKSSLKSYVNRLCNDEGKKVQCVLSNYPSADSECVISVYPQVFTDNAGHVFTNEEMVCWVAGCTAGANVNESLTYASHPDAVEVNPTLTATQQIEALNAGQFILFEEFGAIKNLQDNNTFTTFAPTKGKQFRKNRVIRCIFGVCNDVYSVFSKYYIGNTPNSDEGRKLLKAEILNILNRYQGNGALQNVVADDVTVNKGEESDSVLIEAYIQPVDSIEKIYINITIS